MVNVLLGLYFVVIGASGLFDLPVNPKWVALLALITGIALWFAPYVERAWSQRHPR